MAIKEIGVKVNLDKKQAEKELKDIERDLKSLSKNKVNIDTKLDDIKNAENELRNVQKRINEINTRKIQLDADATKLEQARNELNKTEQAINKVQSMIASMKSKNIQFGLDDKEVNKFKSLQAQLERLKSIKFDLKAKISGFSESEKELKELNSELKDLNNRKAKAKVTLDGAEKVKKSSKEINENINDLNEKKAKVDVTLKNADKTKSEIDKVIDRVNKLNSSGKGLQSLGKTFDSLANHMTALGSAFENTISGKVTNFLTKGIGYSALYRGTSELMNVVEETMAQAVTRYDTLQAVEKSWSNMGFSQKDIAKYQDVLSDKVMGLPTTFDEAIRQTTQISAVTKDLGKAVDVYSALNDAVLAFGGDSEMAQRAILQFSQTIGKGVIDAQTYNAFLNDGMGPALSAIAKKFGYASNEMGKFKDALSARGDSDGNKITSDQFMDALVELDQNGLGSTSALSKMAKDTANVSLSMAFKNMKTRISAGLVDVMKELNKAFENGTGKTLPNIFRDIGNGARKELDGLANYLKEHQSDIQAFAKTIVDGAGKAWDFIKKIDYKTFIKGLKEGLVVIKTELGIAYQYIDKVYGTFFKLLGGGDKLRGFGRYLTGRYGLNIGLKFLSSYLTSAGSKFKMFSTLVALADGKVRRFTLSNLKLSKVLSKKIGSSRIFNKFTEEVPKDEVDTTQTKEFDVEKFKTSMAGHANRMAGIASLAMSAGTLILFAKALKDLNNAIPDDIGKLIPKLTTMGVVMGAMSLAVNQLGKMSINNGWQNQLAGSASLFMSGGALWLMAKGMQEFSKFNIDSNKYGENMKQLFLTMSSFIGAQTVLGVVQGSFGGLGIALQAIGALSTSLAGGSLIAMAKAINEFSKVDIENPGEIKEKMQAMIDILNEVPNLQGSAVGSWFKKKEYQNISQAIESVAGLSKAFNTISKVKIKGNLKSNAVKLFKTAKELSNELMKGESYDIISKWGKQFDGWLKKADIQTVTGVINKLGEMADSMQKLNSMKKLDTDKIKSNVVAMSKMANEISKVLNGDDAKYRVNQKDQSHIAKLPKLYENVQKVMSSLAKMIKSFDALNKLNATTYNWENLKSVISKSVNVLGEMGEEIKSNDNFKGLNQKVSGRLNNLKSAITAIKDSITTMNDLRTYIDTNMQGVDMKDVEKQFSDATNMMGRLGKLFTQPEKAGGDNVFKGLNIDVKRRMSNLKVAIASIKDMMTSIQELRTFMANDMGGVDLDTVKVEFTKAVEMMGEIGKLFTQPENPDDSNSKNAFVGLNQDVKNRMNNLKIAISGIKESMASIQEIRVIKAGMGDVDLKNDVQEDITNVIEMFEAISGKLKSKKFKGLNEDLQARFTTMKEVLNTFKEIFTMLNELNATVAGLGGDSYNLGNVEIALGKLQDLMNTMTSTGGGSFMEAVTNFNAVKKQFSTVYEILNGDKGFIPVITSLSNLSTTVGDFGSIDSMVENAQKAINKIAGMKIEGDNTTFSTEISSLVTKFSEVVTTLTEMASQFNEIGTSYAENFKSGWESIDVASAIQKAINKALENIGKKDQDFNDKGESLGKKFASGLKSGISEGLNDLGTTISTIISGIDFSSMGADAGRSFSGSFNSNVDLTTNTTNQPTKKPKKKQAIGGVVTGPSGIDKVPTMLTAGEYVIKKNTADFLGLPFLNRLNSMNLKGAYQALDMNLNSSQLGSMSFTTVNNITNNSSRSVNISETHNHRAQEVRASRFMRAL